MKRLSIHFFADISKECEINCSINSSRPQYSKLGDSTYEMKNMEIRFTSTSYKFPLKSLCSNGTIDNFDIDLDCEGEYLHGNYTLHVHTMCYLKLM